MTSLRNELNSDETDSPREETATERAQRILMMCNMVEESRQRVRNAERVSEEQAVVMTTAVSDDESEGSHHIDDHDDLSLSCSHLSVSDLSYDQLKEKLRQCQLSVIKLQENSTLKYQKLQVAHAELKKSMDDLQFEYISTKERTKILMNERDEAIKKSELVSETRDNMMTKITNENDELRKKINSMTFINKRLLKQRDEFRNKLDGCNCQSIELEDMSVASRSQRFFIDTDKLICMSTSARSMLSSNPYDKRNSTDREEDLFKEGKKSAFVLERSGSSTSRQTESTMDDSYQRPLRKSNNIFASMWRNTKKSLASESSRSLNTNSN